MKHNIRINGQVQELDCELGSGILDKNGREIFEGDIVKITFTDFDTDAGKVEFFKGEFRVCGEILSNIVYDCEVEIVD